MWHEARRQEKKIRGMMVDYRKRSERRRLYYHQIKADPTQFLRVQGIPCQIYIEEEAAEIEAAASDLMPWQGDKTNLIDRFDVRANLDVIIEPGNMTITTEPSETAVIDQKCQYERWRTLATNDLVSLGEEECLEQIAEDEKIVTPKKGSKTTPIGGSKIGFNYESSGTYLSDEEGSGDDTDKDFLVTEPDLDITFDVRDLDEDHKTKLNEIAAEKYATPDFTRLHIEDRVEAETREYEIKEEQNRAERAAKLSKTERRKEKEERRKTKDVPPYMRVDDPHRKHQSKRTSKRHEKSDSSSDEEKTVQNIEISSSRSNTYKNVKTAKQAPKNMLPNFLQPKISSSGLANLAATRKQLLATSADNFDFDSSGTDLKCNTDDDFERQVDNSGQSSKDRSSCERSAYHRREQSRSRSRSKSSSSRRHRSSSSSEEKHKVCRPNELKKTGYPSPRRADDSNKVMDTRLSTGSNQAQSGCSMKSDSLKAMKPHERLKLKLQSQLKKRQRDEKKKEMAVAEAKEQEAYERAEELRVLKRQLWEKEEEGYWKRREEEEKEYLRKKAEERASKNEESSPSAEKPKSRSRSRSEIRHSRSSHERRSPKRSRPDQSPSESKSGGKISLVPEYDGDEDAKNSRRDRSNSKRERSKSYDRNRSRAHRSPEKHAGSDSRRREHARRRSGETSRKSEYNDENVRMKSDYSYDRRYGDDNRRPSHGDDNRRSSHDDRPSQRPNDGRSGSRNDRTNHSRSYDRNTEHSDYRSIRPNSDLRTDRSSAGADYSDHRNRTAPDSRRDSSNSNTRYRDHHQHHNEPIRDSRGSSRFGDDRTQRDSAHNTFKEYHDNCSESYQNYRNEYC